MFSAYMNSEIDDDYSGVVIPTAGSCTLFEAICYGADCFNLTATVQ